MTNNPTEGAFADINGAKLYYEVAGQGHPLVMVHAGIADSRVWNDQFAEFAQHYRVIRYDQRGYGKSLLPDGPFSFVDDLKGLFDLLGLKSAYLMGGSMGGSSSIDFTLANPNRVDKLILIGSGVSGAPSIEDELTAAKEKAIEDAEEAGNMQLLNELEIQMWVDGLRRSPAKVDPAVRQLALDMNGQSLNQMNPNAQYKRAAQPAYPRLGEIKIPTLVIVGDGDVPETVATADTLATRITGAKKVVIPNTAHLPNMEKPAEFNRLVLDFLRA